jgi:hypothetical protein
MVLDAFILYILFQAGVSASTILDLWLLTLALIIFWTIIAGSIGDRKDIGRLGAWLGVLFGLMGVLMTLAAPGRRRECPWCFLLISKRATVCPHCTEPVSPVEKPSIEKPDPDAR